MSKKEITIYDIAKKLSISSTTVSRGLQNNETINKHTRKKIQDVAKELGYRQNTFAKNLRQQKTNTIGLILHELNSSFITSVLSGIEKITTEEGYDIIITHSSENFEKEVANASNLFHKRVDGIITSLSLETKNLEHFKQFEEKGVPVIFFDRVEENGNNTNVIINNFQCGYDATKHLLQQGCKRIAMVCASLTRNVYAERHRGYMEALKEHQLPYNKNLLLIKDLSEESGMLAAEEILKMKNLPDGIFFTSDFTAAICMQKLQEHGVKIPEDIAIVGFNNDMIGKISVPKLTTINYPGRDMGEIAARNLLNHLQGKSDLKKTKSVIIHSELIVRASSLKKAALARVNGNPSHT